MQVFMPIDWDNRTPEINKLQISLVIFDQNAKMMDFFL